MNACKSCGARIKWIKLKSGKANPVDDVGQKHIDDLGSGATILITEDGRVITKSTKGPFQDGYGYTSHFATCPDADKHRRQ